MEIERGRPSEPMKATSVMAIGAVAGFAMVLGTQLARGRRRVRAGDGRDDRHAALLAYLRDHLAGADVAIAVVEHLRNTHAGTRDGALFASLSDEFTADREMVVDTLMSLGGSPRSFKRAAGRATGAALRAVAGGGEGDLALFRTLESLCIGVQGKRCLWRALQPLAPALNESSRRFEELENRATDQWRRIDDRRRALVSRTFDAAPDARA